MKAVIALVIAVALLAIGIPLSRAISEGDRHTITRTTAPTRPGAESRQTAPARRQPADATGTAATGNRPAAQQQGSVSR